MKRNAKIQLSVLVIFIGMCTLSSTYFDTKKNEVFDDMNKLLYEQIVSLEDIEEVSENNEPKEDANEPQEVVEPTINNEISEPITTTTTKSVIDYSKYYIGYLKIPSIDLEHGFLDKNSKYNNVNKNIYVHPTSDYPDVEKGNLILASHSGTSSISYFKNLYKLKVNDDVYINYKTREFHYVVRRIYKDSKDGTVAIRRDYETTTLTLITCTKNDKTTQTIYICELV